MKGQITIFFYGSTITDQRSKRRRRGLLGAGYADPPPPPPLGECKHIELYHIS
jgi:hypothetical protein